MTIQQIRYTVLETVNEVFRKVGLSEVTTVAANKLSKQMVDIINDVVSDLSDYGNWQETLVSSNITAQSSVANYSIQTSAVVKNIYDMFFQTSARTATPMSNVSVDEMRIMTATESFGQPTQYSIVGVDAQGNPNIRVRSTPVSAYLPAVFTVMWYSKPPMYTTTDDSVQIPFPARIVVNGVMAAYMLNESEGAPTEMQKMYYNLYLDGRRENINRFNFDTGANIAFTPGWSGRRGRRR